MLGTCLLMQGTSKFLMMKFLPILNMEEDLSALKNNW